MHECSHMKAFYCGLVNINAMEIPFCFEFELLRIQPYWFTLLPTKSRKGVAHEVMNGTSAAHALLMMSQTAQGCGFVTFKCGCLTTQPIDQLKNCCECIFLNSISVQRACDASLSRDPFKKEKKISPVRFFSSFCLVQLTEGIKLKLRIKDCALKCPLGLFSS